MLLMLYIVCTFLFLYFILILLILPITYYFVIYKQRNLYHAISLSSLDPNRGSELNRARIPNVFGPGQTRINQDHGVEEV